jgi:surfeit locus 1 family protein
LNIKSAKLRLWLITLSALASFVLTLNLGFWQLNRAREKQTYQDLIVQQGQLSALDATALSNNMGNMTTVLHRQVSLTGRWLNQHTLYLDNRQMNGKPGFFVITPFEFETTPSSETRTILVQRGWVARNFMDRARLPDIHTEPGRVSIVGRIALAPSKLYEFNGDEIGKIRQNVNIAGLEKEFNLKLLDFSVLQIDSEKASANKDGLLRQWLQPNLGIEKHHGYMFQWWALSALIAGLYLWFQVIRPQRNSRV